MMQSEHRPLVSSPGSGRPDRWERLIGAITAAAGPELARRRQEWTVMRQFDAWSRQVYSVAALLILVFGAALILTDSREVASTADGPLLMEAVFPNPLSLWLEQGSEPTLVEVVNAFEEEGP